MGSPEMHGTLGPGWEYRPTLGTYKLVSLVYPPVYLKLLAVLQQDLCYIQ